MKTIIPVKYIIFLTILFLIIFPLLFSFGPYIIIYLLTFGNSIIEVPNYLIIIMFAVGFICEIWWIKLPNCKLIIKNGTVINLIFDGTQNHGWCENISNIKKIELVGKEEVQKYFKDFRRKKAFLIDFGDNNIKYIHAGWFSQKQIKQIIDILSNKGSL